MDCRARQRERRGVPAIIRTRVAGRADQGPGRPGLRAAFLLITVNAAAGALLAVTFVHGWAQRIFAADVGGITYVIAAVFMVGMGICARESFARSRTSNGVAHARYLAGVLVMLGLIGTVLGFIIALDGIRAESAANFAEVTRMVAAMVDGMSVAFYTTLEGAILNLWLGLNCRLVAHAGRK